MGCCHSTPVDDDNPAPPTHAVDHRPPSSSASPLDAPPPIPPVPRFTRSQRQASASAASSSSSPPIRPNLPLQSPSPLPTSPANVSRFPPPWTRAHLTAERAAFFDTRVTGHPETWAAVRLAADLLRQHQLADAQAVLDAADLTCPTGRLESRGKHARGHRGERGVGGDREAGVWDSHGRRYEVPVWVVVDPGDLIEEGEDSGAESEGKGIEEAAGGRDRLETRGEEVVTVRLRRSDGGQDVEVRIQAKEGVGGVQRRMKEYVGGGKKVKLVYLGRVLDETRSLEEQGWKTGHVVNAMIIEGE